MCKSRGKESPCSELPENRAHPRQLNTAREGLQEKKVCPRILSYLEKYLFGKSRKGKVDVFCFNRPYQKGY